MLSTFKRFGDKKACVQLLKKRVPATSLSPKRPSSTFYQSLSRPLPLQGLNSACQGLTDQSSHYSPLCLTLYNTAQNGPEGLISLGGLVRSCFKTASLDDPSPPPLPFYFNICMYLSFHMSILLLFVLISFCTYVGYVQ